MSLPNKAGMDKNKLYGLLVIILFASLFFCYGPTLKGLYSVWVNDEDYNYAFLIPLISAYLIWERRQKIPETPLSVNWVGGLFFFLFLFVSIYGILGSSPSAVRPAIPLIILSIVLFCFGWQMFKLLSFPLVLLVFMIPLPQMFVTLVGIHLKTISTLLGKAILVLVGLSVFVEGNIIDLGVIQLQVVDACSGLRYVLPLLALGVLFAYFFEKNRWKQALLIFFTIPIAIFTNGFRIAATGILASHYGPKVAEGFFHGFSGWLVFFFACGLLFSLHVLMRYCPPRGVIKPAGKTVGLGPSLKMKTSTRKNYIPVAIASSCMLAVGFLSWSTSALPAFKIRGGLSGFPMMIKEWTGQRVPVSAEIIALSGAEDALSAIYQNEHKESVSLYIGYRGSPFGESENFFHSPSVCLPSSGWKTISMSAHDIPNVPVFGMMTVKKMIIERTGERQLVYYWFQTKSRVSHDVNINRFHLTLHALKRDNTHDLFIRPIMALRSGEDEEKAQHRMDQFVRDFLTTMNEFLRDRQYT